MSTKIPAKRGPDTPRANAACAAYESGEGPDGPSVTLRFARKLERELADAKKDTVRMEWLVKFTEFRFRVYDSVEKKFLVEQFAQGVVLRPVIDAAMEKWPNP